MGLTVWLRYLEKVTTEENEGAIKLKEFEDFHDAWVWIKEEYNKSYAALSNPTIEVEFNETPTPERAERLYRYACYILED